MSGHIGAVSLKKSHDIVILSFCNIVKGQAKYQIVRTHRFFEKSIAMEKILKNPGLVHLAEMMRR